MVSLVFHLSREKRVEKDEEGCEEKKKREGGRKEIQEREGKGDEIWRTNWPVALDGHSWIQIFIAT